MKHELLAPAGSPKILRAVIRSGADAVYLGGEKFGARAFAPNFSREDILEALDYAHLRGRKIFLTVNTLLKDQEIGRELYREIEPLYANGLDAIIVQDYGVFQFVKQNFADLPIHVSTQMSVAGVPGAAFLKEQGAARIITARELSLAEICAIHEETGIEIESFVHGALCYCYSGLCLMSSMLGGRSGNRGRCAQPCRLSYRVETGDGRALCQKEAYPLSPKDLCALDLLPGLDRAGVYSFKIEGRMKQLEYAAGVTAVYRECLDRYEADPASYQVSPEERRRLLDLGNRGGFTRGYYEMRNGREMMTSTSSAYSSRPADGGMLLEEKKIPVRGTASIRLGEAAKMEIALATDRCPGGKEIRVSVFGADVLRAQNRPLAAEEVQKRLEKTGDTPFFFADLALELDEGAFLTVGQLNELRRETFARLAEQILAMYWRPGKPKRGQTKAGHPVDSRRPASAFLPAPALNVVLTAPEMLKDVLSCEFADWITLDIPDLAVAASCAKEIRHAGKMAGYCLPHIFRRDTLGRFAGRQKLLEQFDRIWVRSYDSLGFALSCVKPDRTKIALDGGLYVTNAKAWEAFAEAGADLYTISPELNVRELKNLDNSRGELCIYGYQPLMVSAQCVYKNYSACSRIRKTIPEEPLFLRDRYFKKFFIQKYCEDCYNILYNSVPLSLFHHADEVRRLGCASCRIVFVTEGADRRKEVLRRYRESFLEGGPIPPPKGDSFTNGHFCRGVE